MYKYLLPACTLLLAHISWPGNSVAVPAFAQEEPIPSFESSAEEVPGEELSDSSFDEEFFVTENETASDSEDLDYGEEYVADDEGYDTGGTAEIGEGAAFFSTLPDEESHEAGPEADDNSALPQFGKPVPLTPENTLEEGEITLYRSGEPVKTLHFGTDRKAHALDAVSETHENTGFFANDEFGDSELFEEVSEDEYEDLLASETEETEEDAEDTEDSEEGETEAAEEDIAGEELIPEETHEAAPANLGLNGASMAILGILIAGLGVGYVVTQRRAVMKKVKAAGVPTIPATGNDQSSLKLIDSIEDLKEGDT